MKRQPTRCHARHPALPVPPRFFCQILLSLILLGSALAASAGLCNRSWDAEKAMQMGRSYGLNDPIRLADQNGAATSDTITVAQLAAFYEANQGIAKVTGLSPTFIICDDKEPNAFAMPTNGGMVVGVTLGMFKLVDGDRDMAAETLGHEYTHHIRHHIANAQVRRTVLNLLGMVIGTALESRMEQKYRVQNVGYDLGNIGFALLSRKFDRDQEREADADGLKYMMQAGFSPAGAVRLMERFQQVAAGGRGLYFDDHPATAERIQTLKTLIAQSEEAQRILASQGEYTKLALAGQQPEKEVQVATLQPGYQTSDAEKSFNDALQAFARKDYAEGLGHLRAAADAGHAQAQAGLGYLYAKGMVGVPKDEKEAVRLFRLSADQGNALGQNNLGYAYSIGYGVTKDYDEAIRLLRLSVEQGNPLAQANLGFMYENGIGLKKDMAEAARLYKLGADQGDVTSQTNLGSLYFNGLGVDKDYAEAARFTKLAAEQGFARAQYNFGYMLINGMGVEKNKEAAIAMFRKAAAQGQPDAIASLKKLSLM